MGSYKKKLFIVLLLFLLISCFVCSSVNANMDDMVYDTNVQDLLQQQQEILANLGITYLEKFGSDTIKNSFKNFLNNDELYCYWTLNTNNNSAISVSCYFINKSINWNNYDNLLTNLEDSYMFDVFNIYPVSGYSFSASDINKSYVTQFNFYTWNRTMTQVNYTGGLFLPSLLILYNNNTAYNYSKGINPSSNLWSMLFNSISENTDAVEDTTQAVNNLRNDFNEEESSSDYDFPTDNPTSDPTSNGIDTIFNLFYSRINNWEANIINVPIPFTNKSFSISPTITEDIVDGFAQTTQISRSFKYLLGMVWYYLLGRYIVKDVQKYVDGLQTGEILTKSDTNIKTEML